MVDKELNIKLNFTSQATQGFATATQRASRFKVAVQRASNAFKLAGANILVANTKLGASARAMVRVSKAARNMARAVGRTATRGFSTLGRLAGRLGGILRGGLMVGITAVIGGVFALGGAFGAMREAMEGSADALGAVDDQAEDAAGGLSDAADAGTAAVEQIQGAFGAFGAVGEGFVQQQGRLAEETASVMDTAVSSAESASAALDDARDSLGGATQATTRFGRATDRISSAFAKAKRIILQAIAKAITPALEKFADLLESPAFQEFVDLLAKDLAKAAAAVGRWFINKVIPAIMKFMEAVNEAGGPIEFVKGKFQEWKTTAKTVLAIIVGAVLIASNKIREFFERAWLAIKTGFEAVKFFVLLTLQAMVSVAQNILTGMGEIIKDVFNNIIAAIERAINSAIAVINPFISLFNALAEATGGSRLQPLGNVSLPRLQAGGIIDTPTAAIVGDAPSPEVVSPLDDLIGIIQEALGTAGLTINVAVPAGTPSPQVFGQSVGDSIIREMRAQGLRIPV